MEFTISGTIQCPRDLLVKLMFEADHMLRWQKTLIIHEQVSGEPNQPGAQCRLTNMFGNKRIETAQTIGANSLPDGFLVYYETRATVNQIAYRFEDRGEATDWELHSDVRCGGILKLFQRVFPGLFKGTAAEDMKNLTIYAENFASGQRA